MPFAFSDARVPRAPVTDSGAERKNLCSDGQAVKGLVICRDPDPKLSYALEMRNNIDVRYYSVAFKLREAL
jgi:hypothetical protein